MPFERNNKANPHGRPRKGKSIPDILRKLGRENLEPALKAVYDLAKTGDISAMNFIAERTEGKVTQGIKIEDSTINITVDGKALVGNDNA